MNEWVIGLALASSASVVAVPNGVPPTPGRHPLQTAGVHAAELRVEPGEIRAGMFFHGATVTVSALVPDDLAVAVVCVGADESVVLNRKGKVLGLIWMNVGEVEFDDAPNLYLLHASARLEVLAAPAARQALTLGYGALEERVRAATSTGNPGDLFQELVRLKESEGLYAIAEGSVRMIPASPGMTRITTEFRLPAKTPAGDYEVLVYGFSRGDGALLETGVVRLTQVGVASFIAGLAAEHGLLYGALAVVVAISVGLLTGMLFDLRSRKRR